jgi:acyl carrier protein
MDDIEKRLTDCFRSVFPELDITEVSRASASSVGSWDSIAMLNLISVVEEEFNVRVPIEEMEQLMSFELILDFLRRTNAH